MGNHIEDEKRFNDARKELVVKRVDSIQLGRNSFTLVEQKAVDYMISKIKPNDSPDTEYRFNIKEFCRMINWHRMPTKEILGMLQTIANKSWWILNKNGKNESVYELKHWFDVVRLNEDIGVIIITFSKTVWPYIFNLLEQKEKGEIYIASWTVDAISLMKNQYSPRIFELLRTYQFNNQEWRFENGTGTERDLQTIIADHDEVTGKPLVPKAWANWACFNRDVLIPAKREINKYTDLMIDYEPIKTDFEGNKYRKYVATVFRLAEKTSMEKADKDKQIAIEYDNVIMDEEYQQLSLFNEFNKERAAAEAFEQDEIREREINKSKYPLYKAMFPEFNDVQLERFTRASLVHIQELGITFHTDSEKELWIADYIDEYYKSIKASSEETKTSFYARLMDCLVKDYKNVTGMVSRSYGSIETSASQTENNGSFKGEEAYLKLKPESAVKDEISQDDMDELFEEQLLGMVRKTGK